MDFLSNRPQQQQQHICQEFDKLASMYQRTLLTKRDPVTILKIIIYFPFGVLLITIRLFLLFFLIILLNLNVSTLRTNRFFIRLTCAIFGMHTPNIPSPSIPSAENNSNELIVYISNHITCLDYFSIKSIVNHANYFSCEQDFTSNCLVTKRPGLAATMIMKFFVQMLQTKPAKENLNDTYRNRQNYPIIYFPEMISTGCERAVLKFDPKPFDIDLESCRLSIQPVCITIHRPFLSISINSIYSSDFFNFLLIVFSPVTIFNLKFLEKQCKRENESSAEFAERVRQLIATSLNLELSEYGHEQMNAICNQYQQLIREDNVRSAQQISQQQHQRQRSNIQSNINFNDISRVALQIKEILPEVSFETIQRHVRASSSLDIDTVIASILDAGATSESVVESLASTSASFGRAYSSPGNMQQSKSSTACQIRSPASSGQLLEHSLKAPRVLKSYDERKFELLNEARKRYLAKNPN